MKLKINGRLCESVEDVRQCASEKLAAFVEECRRFGVGTHFGLYRHP